MAAKAAHAPVFSEDGATLDPAGDENLRASYHAAQAEAMDAIDPSPDHPFVTSSTSGVLLG